jgi:hypothetical protein
MDFALFPIDIYPDKQHRGCASQVVDESFDITNIAIF